MLEGVEWGKYRVGDLFAIEKTLSFDKDALTSGNDYDYVTRTSQNQGIFQSTGFVNQDNLNEAGVWSLGLLQMDFFYREREWYAGQFVRKVKPIIRVPKYALPFLTTILNGLKPLLLSVLVRNVDSTFLNAKVWLPIGKNGNPDYAFMGCFVAELKAHRHAELKAYLLATGLLDYELSNAERRLIERYDKNKVVWKEFKIDNLFRKISTAKLPYVAKELPKEPKGLFTLPCLTSSFQNQGLNYYAPREGATILQHVISIPSNSDVYRAYYQSNDFTVLSDSYAIEWKYDQRELTREQYLALVTFINKVTDRPIYSYKNKLSWNKAKDKYIVLPTKDGAIDFGFMQTFIASIQKLVIKDVVLYADRELKATEQVINHSFFW